MQSGQPSGGRTSRSTDPDTTTLRTFFQLRTLQEKLIFQEVDGEQVILSREVVQVGPTMISETTPEENPLPTAHEAKARSRAAVGYWRRLRNAARKHGLDGDLDDGV